MIESAGIIYGFGDSCYKFNNHFYQQSNDPADLILHIVDIPRITPLNWSGVTMNALGHFEGEIHRIEEFQSEKLRNNIDVGTNLSSYLRKIKQSIYLKKIDSIVFSRNNKKDFFVIDENFYRRQVASVSDSEIFAFQLYDNDQYVGIEATDTWPTMLVLKAQYKELVGYLKENGLYENRWPYTHTWQNGLEFVHITPIIQTDQMRIWSTGYFQSFNSLFLRDEFYPKLGPNDYVLITDWGTVYPSTSCMISKAKHKNNIFWCANGETEVQNLKKSGISQSYLISHNAFVDPNTFSVKSLSKKYDAIFCQTLIPFKRPGLTSKLRNVVYSTGSSPTIDYQRMVSSCGSELMVASSPQQVSTLMNQSYCGLSLSLAEGGNYATTEYLLSGIPVVNTYNLGGRDTYLDDTNSVLAQEDTPEEIARCVKYIIDNKNKYNPSAIRGDAMRRNSQMINTLKKEILYPICSAYNINNQTVDELVYQHLNNKKVSSKGRTAFQPESSLMKI